MNGHTICEDCSMRCQNCPVCRVPYDAGVIRNLLMEEMRDVMVRFFGIPQEETPTNSDTDLPLPGNDDDSDSTIILNMDEHMQRMEGEYIDTPASPVSLRRLFRPGEYIHEWAPISFRVQPQSITRFVRGDP
ncbi:hypothetical protein JTB14_004466 [Gonioctena quinquepunctata]|nr:hypothetical protein JTB14_004466 [Gonioctena quinquepunctata]